MGKRERERGRGKRERGREREGEEGKREGEERERGMGKRERGRGRGRRRGREGGEEREEDKRREVVVKRRETMHYRNKNGHKPLDMLQLMTHKCLGQLYMEIP